MKTFKKGLKQKNIDSKDIQTILVKYSHKDKVKIALYAAEDCFHLNPIEESQLCIDLIKKWLKDEKSVTSEELRISAYAAYAVAANAATAAAYSAAANAANAAYWAVAAFGVNNRESKREEYLSYARLFAYEDLDFKFRKEARTFNLDNETDLNIFLDFLTDNYPDALFYPREEYFKTKLAKEELKLLYQL